MLAASISIVGIWITILIVVAYAITPANHKVRDDLTDGRGRASVRNSQAGIAHTANGGLGTQTIRNGIQQQTNSTLRNSDEFMSQGRK